MNRYIYRCCPPEFSINPFLHRGQIFNRPTQPLSPAHPLYSPMPQARPSSIAMTEKTAALLDPPVGPEAGAGPGVPDDREEVHDGGAVDIARKVLG